MEEKSQRDILVQLILTRKYNKQGITLPDKFWNLPKYKEEYRLQSMFAAKLFRAYSSEAIFNVIRRESWCWSLKAKKIPDMIEVEQARLLTESKIKELKESEKPVDLPSGLPTFRKKLE